MGFTFIRLLFFLCFPATPSLSDTGFLAPSLSGNRSCISLPRKSGHRLSKLSQNTPGRAPRDECVPHRGGCKGDWRVPLSRLFGRMRERVSERKLGLRRCPGACPVGVSLTNKRGISVPLSIPSDAIEGLHLVNRSRHRHTSSRSARNTGHIGCPAWFRQIGFA